MTTFEIISIVLASIGTFVSLGGLIISLLSFLDKRNRRKK